MKSLKSLNSVKNMESAKQEMNTLKMPSFGADMEAGILTEWLVKAGDVIEKNQVVAVIETQKGAIDFEAFNSGIVRQLLVKEGESVPVGAPIAQLEGEVESQGEVIVEAQPVIHDVKRPPNAVEEPAASIPSRSAAGSLPVASPYARKIAHDKNINLSSVVGSGPAGAILAKDLEHSSSTPTNKSGKDGMRAAIAAALGRSKREIPHYYLEDTIDVQKAVDWLSEVNRDRRLEEQILLNALLHCAVARALKKSPELNGFYENGQFTPAEHIHLATGISMRGGGLISPAIQHADRLSPDEMMTMLKGLSDRVRNGRLRSSEMSTATVTLSSMGDRGAEKMFGIIYPPQVALIGIGKPQLRPWVIENEIQPRTLVSVSLAADHRVSDGRQGAKFLSRLNKILQKPEQL